MANNRRLREKSHLPRDNWSDWRRAMVPRGTEGNFVRRGWYQSGLRCRDIRLAFPEEAPHCGIYEWQARGTAPNQRNKVVYVGSTCRGRPGSLGDRINEYCNSGSHKSTQINGALRRGYELWVRVKTSGERREARDMERDLLQRYDYAWNNKVNENVRDILPQGE